MSDSEEDIVFEEIPLDSNHSNGVDEDNEYEDVEWDQVGDDHIDKQDDINIDFAEESQETQEIDFSENNALSSLSTTTSPTMSSISTLDSSISSGIVDDNSMDISIEIDTTKKKRASNQVRYTNHQKKKIMNLHKSVLLCFLLNFKHTLKTLNDELIHSLVFSSIPQDLYQIVDSYSKQQSIAGKKTKKTKDLSFNEMINEIVKSYSRQYKLDPQLDPIKKIILQNNNNNNNNRIVIDVDDLDEKSNINSSSNSKDLLFNFLISQLNNRILSSYGYVQIFYLVLKIIGLTCRMVTFINPPLATPETPTKQKKIQSLSNSPTLKRSHSAPEKIKESKDEETKKNNSKKKKKKVIDTSSESEDESDYKPPKKGVTTRQNALQRSKSAPISVTKSTKRKKKVESSSSESESDSDNNTASEEEEEEEETKRKKKKVKTTRAKTNTTPTKPTPIVTNQLDHLKVEYWVEVLDSSQNKWISVDVINQRIDQPHLIEPPNNPFAYVVSFSNNQFKDTTSKYTNNPVVSHLKRLPNASRSWWTDLLEKNSISKVDNEEKSDGVKSIEDHADKNDDQLVIEKESQSKNFPTSLSAFKSHPLYILERDIPKYSSLEPSAKSIGKFKSDNIYHRSSVKVLHVADKWIQHGRTIMEGEQPIKVVKGKSGSSPTALLYGEWQTLPYQPPLIKNGIVPMNSFGNVFLYKPEMVPIGGVHLKMRGLVRVARKLKISVGPALVGWENCGRRSRPKIEGVVVAKEYAKTLVDAWIEDQQIRNEKEEKKRIEEIEKRWRRFTKGLLINSYVEKTYVVDANKDTLTSKLFAEDDENNPFKEKDNQQKQEEMETTSTVNNSLNISPNRRNWSKLKKKKKPVTVKKRGRKRVVDSESEDEEEEEEDESEEIDSEEEEEDDDDD